MDAPSAHAICNEKFTNQSGKAVDILCRFDAERGKTKKQLLGNEGTKVQLQFAFKKVPKVRNKCIRIPVPHPTYDAGVTNVCLFVKDRTKDPKEDYDATVRQAKRALAQDHVEGVSEVISVCQLRMEYKPFEAKRKLCNAYDMFIADRSVIKYLGALLGKEFFRAKKLPIGVNMGSNNLAKEISSKLSCFYCVLSGGSTCTVNVGSSLQPRDHLVENIEACSKKIIAEIPGGAQNIRSFHLKTHTSPSLPIYISTESPNAIQLDEPVEKIEEDEAEEVTTVPRGKVKITPDHWVLVVKNEADAKKRKPWQKVRYDRNKNGMSKKRRMGKANSGQDGANKKLQIGRKVGKTGEGSVEDENLKLVDEPISPGKDKLVVSKKQRITSNSEKVGASKHLVGNVGITGEESVEDAGSKPGNQPRSPAAARGNKRKSERYFTATGDSENMLAGEQVEKSDKSESSEGEKKRKADRSVSKANFLDYSKKKAMVAATPPVNKVRRFNPNMVSSAMKPVTKKSLKARRKSVA